MTVRECYEEMGADYNEVLRRLANEARVERFLRKFPEDKSYLEFIQAMNEKDYSAAFRSMHTLKGICLNLSIKQLAESSSALTEALREGQWKDEIDPLFERVRNDYNNTVQAIEMLKNT